MTDQFVYVLDKEFSWIPGLLVEQTDDFATVSVATYKSEEEITGDNNHGKGTSIRKCFVKDYPNNSLPLQNVVDGRVKEVADMVELSFLHEAAILYNLKTRHTKDTPYTRTGNIVIAVNPYQWFQRIYTEENRTRYSRALVWEAARKDYDPRNDLPPHVYEVSSLAYRGLSIAGMHQSILVSGESGAGKTETVKICMNHLASVVQQEHLLDGDPTQDQGVIARILDSNPLLEAFGNAKTRRNDNSSRFGKYVKLQFKYGAHNRNHLALAGSISTVYLLEKSRVVRHDESERTFHIFYQLLAAPGPIKAQFWDKLKGTSNSSFSYVGETDTVTIEGISDADQFQKTIKSLGIIGIRGQLLQTFIKAICIVMQLGNITFGQCPKDSDHSVIESTQELNDLADLMGIPQKRLETTLITRLVKVRSDTTSVPLNQEAAKDSADALAKQIYDRLFSWLVKIINKATTAGKEDEHSCESASAGQEFGIIGLLDIFGFESFPVNSFEQLCINYANEQLQQKFTKDVFVSVFEEYQEEGIGLDAIQYDDNTHVLDLIQNKTGLLAMLNEECIRPRGSDYGFVNKALHANKGSPALIVPRIVKSNVEFGIRHYAGDVMYDATDFVTKNQDTLPSDLMECACTSSNDIISKELNAAVSFSDSSQKKSGPPIRKKSNLVAPTAWTKYKGQLVRLMADLHKTQSRYIRCVKPNSFKKPRVMEHELTLQQLRSSGVISAVILARSAFPNRLEHTLILSRFYPLWPPSTPRKHPESPAAFRKQSETLLNHALKIMERDGAKAFVIGNSRTYFRGGALEFLEVSRLKSMEKPATMIQSHFRCYLAQRLAYRTKHKAELERLERMHSQALTIQYAWRCAVARLIVRNLRKVEKAKAKKAKEEKQRKRAAIKIQCATRVLMARKERETLYVRYIKDQTKKLKKQKKLKKMGKAATRLQKHMRGCHIRQKYGNVIEKAKERGNLRDKIEKIKKKTGKIEKTRIKELEKAQNGIDTEGAGREAWEESVLAESEEGVHSEIAMMVEFLQGEHRKLQIRSKTLDGMIKPLKKNFEILMEENTALRDEFAEIHKKNEAIKASNKELVEKRGAAGKRASELKEELKSASNRFMPVAQGRLDFQKALKEILELLEKRCKDGQLIEDVTLVAYQCQADAKTLQAGAEDANEAEFQFSPQKQKMLGGQFSNASARRSALSTKARRSAVRGSLAGLDSAIGSPGMVGKGGRNSFDVGSKNKLPKLKKKSEE